MKEWPLRWIVLSANSPLIGVKTVAKHGIRNIMKKHFTIAMTSLLFTLPTFGGTINLAAGLTVEPYIITATNSGFEADIVREAFALEGHTVQYVFQPLKRTKSSFKDGTVDGVLTIQSNYPEIKDAFVSDEYISYENFAVALASKDFKIGKAADLSGKSIISFQQARYALGKEFEAMATSNPGYTEKADQKLQIAMIYGGRVDVIVLDRRIFDYYRNQLLVSPDEQLKHIDFNQKVTFHKIFEPSVYRMAFKSAQLRDSFNSGLKKLKASGRYDAIITAYLKEKMPSAK